MGRGPPPPPPPSATSTLLGKYRMGRMLGRGSFAKVYKAQSLADEAPVAIKIIDKLKTHAAMEPLILREISAMRRLQDHPNVLKIHEVMATKSKIYIVMELATGGELFAKIARHGKLPESLARRYFQQLVSALRFCHESGVAHRDVKPQNLLLDGNGDLKVSDFGLSALPEQLKNGLLHTACGTPAYTAPEVLYRVGYDGSKADAWSCGVILFVLLAGHLPFDDSNLVAMHKKIQRRDYVIPAAVSKPARRIIYQLLDPNPNTRLSVGAVMEKPWFQRAIDLKSASDGCDYFAAAAEEKPKCDGGVSGMNAFDIISMSSGLDLSGLFEAENRRERRFTANVAADKVAEKVGEVGERMGYKAERGKGGMSVGLGKGGGKGRRVVLVVEMMEVAVGLVLGEVKVVEGSGVEFPVLLWEDLRTGLGDVVMSWQHGVV
ncbi:CBL-interacting serine/threonine-protein kinase 4 [Argentina anserina]|uniref:CBL-interacting serine/threonine-protein kinase 4 n=1 Tax=Argentina anserina TaxID=57926 RepID=UPI002176803D|nr:CBL-interacting serine/threonine-protein kinase 4 [Potentilla anserina]